MVFNKAMESIIKSKKSEKPLSRLFGYSRSSDNQYNIIKHEAQLISYVINELSNKNNISLAIILDKIMQELNTKNIRNRSNKKWTKKTLIGLIRPVYAGCYISNLGVWRTSRIYPPIVSPDLVRNALKRIKSEKLSLYT